MGNAIDYTTYIIINYTMRITPIIKMSASSTIVIGLNGALQKRFVLPPETSLVPGNVHRAIDVQTGVGGKGQDVAITLSCLNFQRELFSFGISLFAPLLAMGAFSMVIVALYTKNPCKPVDATVTNSV